MQNANAGGQFEPELSVKLAACWVQAGISDKAKESLVRLLHQNRATRILLGGKEVPLLHRDEDALSWLARVRTSNRRRRSTAATSGPCIAAAPAETRSATAAARC